MVIRLLLYFRRTVTTVYTEPIKSISASIRYIKTTAELTDDEWSSNE